MAGRPRKVYSRSLPEGPPFAFARHIVSKKIERSVRSGHQHHPPGRPATAASTTSRGGGWLSRKETYDKTQVSGESCL